MAVVRRSGPGAGKVAAVVKGLDGLEAKVGWFESALYPDGTPVAYVATIHEFGTGKIPARPFMRPAVAEYGQSWLDQLATGARMAVQSDGAISAIEVLDAVAQTAAGNVGQVIKSVMSPALKPVTIARKGHAKPLIDTGQMFQSVTGKVEKT